MTGGRTAPRLAMVLAAGVLCGIVLAGSAHAQDDPAALNAEVERLYQAGKVPEATEIAKRSLAIGEKLLGPDHPDVATSINNLAVLYKAQARHAEARSPLLMSKFSDSVRPIGVGAVVPDSNAY